MLICAGRKALIVAVEIVNYYGVFEKEPDRPGTTDETDHGNQQCHRGPFHSCCHLIGLRIEFLEQLVLFGADGVGAQRL
jgi:hypothetical protein